MVNYRGFAWINEDEEHSEEDHARAQALANHWSQLHHEAEQRHFARLSDMEEGRDYEPEFDSEEDEAEFRQQQKLLEAERQLEIELIEDKLAAIGARMMRPYEHWNEDERLMEWLERDR